MTRYPYQKLVVVLLLATGLRSGWAGETAPLIFGVFPYVTARQVVETYRPVAAALEKQLQRPVRLYTARDFKTFAERTRQGEYDILLTAPHLAWLARHDAGYRPQLKHAEPIHGVLVVKSDSAFGTPEALRGRTLATADPGALVVLALKADLAARGLKRGADYQATNAGTHINAAMQVINGRADGAMLAQQSFQRMRPELRQKLRVIAETQALPGLIYLTSPNLRDTDAELVRKALMLFTVSPEGKKYIKLSSHGSIEPIREADLDEMRPFAQHAQKEWQQTP